MQPVGGPGLASAHMRGRHMVPTAEAAQVDAVKVEAAVKAAEAAAAEVEAAAASQPTVTGVDALLAAARGKRAHLASSVGYDERVDATAMPRPDPTAAVPMVDLDEEDFGC